MRRSGRWCAVREAGSESSRLVTGKVPETDDMRIYELVGVFGGPASL